MKSIVLTTIFMYLFSGLAAAEERSPFTDVLYTDSPSVTVVYEDETYFLLSVNGIKRADIMTACEQSFGESCQEMFALNFLEVMAAVGATIGDTVDLRLYKFSGHRVVKIDGAAVTAENVEDIMFNRDLRGE